MKKINLLFISLFAFTIISFAQKNEKKIITEAWHSGKTLPLEIGKQYPPEKINLPHDNGYNVLIDISHQCSFAYMWDLPDILQNRGYRTISSQASLNTVLNPKGKSRVRIPFDKENKIYPFAWYPNFKYNVVVTQQGDPASPKYTDVECKALVNFVSKGGALVILGNPVKKDEMGSWSINKLAAAFDAQFTNQYQQYQGRKYAGLSLNDDWQVISKGSDGKAVQAQREFGKGRIVIDASLDDFLLKEVKKEDSDEMKRMHKIKSEYITKVMAWLCEKQKLVGGEPRLPQTMGGGGAIYPELEGGTEGIIVYYAPNIDPKLLKCVEVEFPKITKKVLEWLPSDPTKEPMYLILSAGGGGGWAVNAFKPKENGIISLDDMGLLSIYAHELAHTLGGPSNDKGEKAGESPIGNQGEAHAGWFQGKVDALYKKELESHAVKESEKYFMNPEFKNLDIKRYREDEEYNKKFIYGADWTKLWYIWQRMDDTYGPTWYPRWKLIQYQRWADDPKRNLTWEETIEDMSIAVGEDLFPFFVELNTNLKRNMMGEVEFQGKKITLPKANIAIVAPGNVKLGPIGDYKKPLPNPAIAQ